MQRSTKFPIYLIFLGVALLLPAQTSEDAAWVRVVTDQREGLRLRERELAATGAAREQLNHQRVEAFRRTANDVNAFMKSFLPDTQSVRYLNAAFQLGYYSELAGWDERALALYNICRSHKKLGDSAAVFGTPPQALKPFLEQRIEVVLKRLNLGTDQADVAHDQLIFAKYSGKGGILLAAAHAPSPLSNENAMRVSARLSFPENVDLARVEWRKLLEQRSELNPIVEDASFPGLLVFGVKGTSARAGNVARVINTFRQDLVSRYFDSGLSSPTLVVIANLAAPGELIDRTSVQAADVPVAAPRTLQQESPQPQQQQLQMQQQTQQRPPSQPGPPVRQGTNPEDLGRLLSSTIHFREMTDMEGYFEPLDNTLILRKNLVNERGELFLGTALHELVHALIQADYPQAPMWLNEGMAALHEEFGPSDPHDNYRLYVAREAMKSGRWLTLHDLLEPKPVWWGSAARPVMAAAARYFCMYLAKEGYLAALYKAMRLAQAGTEGSSGDESAATLQRITGMTIEQLNVRWQDDISHRDLDALNSRWGNLRQSIRYYLQDMPALADIR